MKKKNNIKFNIVWDEIINEFIFDYNDIKELLHSYNLNNKCVFYCRKNEIRIIANNKEK